MENPNKKRDKHLCKSITSSLGDIVRYSMNENFRNSCFELFNVDSTKSMQEKVGETLNNFCDVNFKDITPKKQLSSNRENTPKQGTVMQQLEITPKREFPKSTKQLLGNGSRNWLNVAAQQTRDTIRRQSLDGKNKQKIPRPYLNIPTRFKTLEDSEHRIVTTPSNSNLPLPSHNPNYLIFDSPHCPSVAAGHKFNLEKTRKVLFLENNNI